MAKDLIGIILKTNVNIEDIKAQLDELQKDIKPIDIKLNIDKSSVKAIKDLNASLEKMGVNKMPKTDMSKVATDMKSASESTKEYNQRLHELIHLYKTQEISSKDFVDRASKFRQETEFKNLSDKQQLQLVTQLTKADREHTKVLDEKTKINKRMADEQAKIIQRSADLQKKMLSISGIDGEMDTFARKNKGRYDETEFARIKKEIQEINDIPIDQQSQKMKNLSIEWGNLKQTAAESGGVMAKALEGAFKFARFYIVGQAIVTLKRGVQDGIRFVKELDKELTQVSVITGMSRDQTRELAKSYGVLAGEMSKTVAEISSVNTELVRQGLSLEESQNRMDTILKLSAASGIETSQSLKIITSAVNALGAESEKTADVMLRAANISASDVGQIGDAFTRVASAARATGLDITELNAILSTLIEVTQERPGALGNSLKTLLARFNRINEETGELNEDFNDVSESFKSVGIAFTDAEGQIRPVYDLLKDLSGVWGTLDKNTKMYIATQAAGVRNQNRFLAIMDNFNRVQEINNDLIGSGGTLAEAYGVYLDSVEASASRAKAALETMWINAINSDVIKHFYDIGTAIIKIIDKLKLLNIAVVGLSIAGIIKGMQLLGATMVGFTIKLIAFNVAQFGAAEATKNLSAALWASPLFKFALVAAGLTGVIKLIDKFSNSLENQTKKVSALSSEFKELTSERDKLRSMENRTEDEEKYLKILEAQVIAKKDALAIEKEKEAQLKYLTSTGSQYSYRSTGLEQIEDDIKGLKKLQSQLSEMYSDEATDIEKINEVKSKQNKIASTLTDSYRELKDELETMGHNAPQELIDILGALEDVLEGTELYKQALRETEGHEVSQNPQSLDELAKKFDEVTSKIQNYNSILEELNSAEGLSAKSKQDIISKYHDLLPYLNDEKDLREQIIKVLEAEEIEQEKLYRSMILNSKEFYEQRIKDTNILAEHLGEFYTKDLQNAKSLAEAKLIVERELLKNLTGMWSRYYDASRNTLTYDYAEQVRLENTVGYTGERIAGRIYQEVVRLNKAKQAFDNIVGGFTLDLKDINLGKVSKGGASSSKPVYDFDKDLETLESFLLKYIQKRGELEKQAIDNWYKMETDALEKLHKEKVDKLKDELDEFKNVVNERIRYLKDEYEEEDYYDDLATEQKTAREMQRQIDRLSLDDSTEARNKMAKLREDLQKQNEKIADKERKKERDIKIEALQDSIKIRETETNNIIKELDDQYKYEKENLEKIFNLKVEVWEKEYENAAMYTEAYKAITTGFVKDFEGKMVSIKDAFTDFEDTYGKGMGALGDRTKGEFLDAVDRVALGLKGLVREAGYVESTSGRASKSIDAVGTSARKTKDDVDKLTKSLENLTRESSKIDRGFDNADYYMRRDNAIVAPPRGSYSSGGKINYTGLANVHGSKLEPEYMFNYEQFRDLAKYIAYEKNKVTPILTPSLAGVGGFTVGSLINVEGNLTEDILPKVQRAGRDAMRELAELIKLKG